MHLDARQTATAIGIAKLQLGGFSPQYGHDGQALHSAMRRVAGSKPQNLHGRGFRRSEIIEASLGFLQAVVNPEDRDLAAITERLGRPFVLEDRFRIKLTRPAIPRTR